MKRVALLGMPNTGKSTFFNRLTGAAAKVGNWPGVTVDLLSAKVLLGAEMVEIVDLPGIYNLHGFAEDERVARRFLEENAVDLLLVIVNATQLDRQLALVLQLQSLGLPILVLLNMGDEATRLGIQIDESHLSADLQIPVLTISAKHGHGFGPAKTKLTEMLRSAEPARKASMTEVFADDDALESRLDQLFERNVNVPLTSSERFSDRLDRILLHPWFGLPMFFLAMLGMFEAVYTLGAPLQDAVAWLLEVVKADAVTPAVIGWSPVLQSFLLDGLFDGVGTVLSFLPIIVLFFLFMAIVEDSGYLSRAAFLMDAFMSRLGLDGRAFVMQLMGFGCNVPALMGTRVMRSRGLRLLTMLIIPFSLCSARLQVFVFFTTAIFEPWAAPLVLFSLYVASFLAAFMTAVIYRHRLTHAEPLLLELPPYRFPTGAQMWLRGWREVTHFLREASGFILLGVVLVWFLTHYPFGIEPASAETLAGRMSALFAPIFEPIGIDNLMTIALIFGFVAKEIVLGAMAVIYGVGEGQLAGIVAGRTDWVQAYSFMLFVLIYTPCLSTVAVLKQESKSWKFTAFAVGWPLFLAWSVSFIFYQGARWLGL
ncbi:MAG: ferrous iron transport protein B [Gammaproteobacteria bacterium]|nr:ferrous iron transport protein B [Gammaproteobacteria bacterium]MCP5136489.1 ferrous iron transport protein B [Gammaproteobacteria bacterium]